MFEVFAVKLCAAVFLYDYILAPFSIWTESDIYNIVCCQVIHLETDGSTDCI